MFKSISLFCILYLSHITLGFTGTITLTPDEEKAVFLAANYKLINKEWRKCYFEDDKTYEAGRIEEVRDINGDGLLDSVVTEASLFCYGNTGVSFSLVSKQVNGEWKYITSGVGYVNFLNTKGADGWPDIELAGPGFCFPVSRFNGEKYLFNRRAYDGKPCERK